MMTDRDNASALRDIVQSAVDAIQNGWLQGRAIEDDDSEEIEALEITFTVNRIGEVRAVHLLVSFGGPTVFVDIRSDGHITGRGYWWSQNATVHGQLERPDVFDHFAQFTQFSGGAR